MIPVEVGCAAATMLVVLFVGNSIFREIGKLMALVQVDQTDLDSFAAAVETEVTAVGSAVSVLSAYIQQLVAGQAVPLPAADESAVSKALGDLSAAVSGLSALEPPAPAPSS